MFTYYLVSRFIKTSDKRNVKYLGWVMGTHYRVNQLNFSFLHALKAEKEVYIKKELLESISKKVIMDMNGHDI